MCFGSSQQSTTNTNSNYTPAPWLSSAAQNNINFASNLQSTGFSPYTGQQVANFSPQQTSSFGMGQGIAGAVTPNVQTAGTNLGNFLQNTASNPTITPETIASQMSPYMNQYVDLALKPQLTAAQAQQAQNLQLMQGQATSAGAFGDPRAQNLMTQQELNNTLANQSLIGNAYNAAFNTAIGAGAQDVSNNLNAQIAQGQLGLGTQAQQLAGINTAFGQGVTGTNLENTLGSQQTAQQQANLNALYNQWLMAQQYPFQTTQLVNQSIQAGTPAAPSSSSSTQVQTTPNNAGYGIIGALGGAALNAFLPGAGTALSGMLASNGSGAPMQFSPATGPGSYGNGYSYPMYAKGGRPEPGKPAVVGEKGPELFVPDKDDGMLHRAFGGPVLPNMPTMVGERGPEMFVPQQGGAGGGFNPASFMQSMQQNPQLMQRFQAMMQQWRGQFPQMDRDQWRDQRNMPTQAGGGFRPPSAGMPPQMAMAPPPIADTGRLPTQLPPSVVPGASVPPINPTVQPMPMNFGGGQIANAQNQIDDAQTQIARAGQAIPQQMPGMQMPTTGAPNLNMPGMSMRAKGGPVNPGEPTIVGENGPEVITPQQSGTVVPYDRLKAAIKKKKGVALDGLSKQLGADAA